MKGELGSKMTSIDLVTAEDIRRIRKILRLTQKELAKRANVSQSLIARIENKTIDPRLSTVRKIIDALAQDKEKKTAADAMHSPVITIDVRDSVRTAVDLMKKYNISQLPVLKEKRIVGSIRESTILNNIMKKGNPEKVFSSTVFNVMETAFSTVSSSTLISDVVYQLSEGETAVLVIDDNKIVGIITKIDVISSAVNLRARNTTK